MRKYDEKTTIAEALRSVDVSAFVRTNPTDEPIPSGLPSLDENRIAHYKRYL